MAFEALLAYSRIFGESETRREESRVGSIDVLHQGHSGDVYHEFAFQHFLDVERVRADRSNRRFLLLLVSLRRCPVRGTRFSSSAAASLLQGLGVCVREVDFIGWYRDGHVAGAVLAQGFDEPTAEAPNRILERVTRILRARLSADLTDRLRIRVVRLGPPRK